MVCCNTYVTYIIILYVIYLWYAEYTSQLPFDFHISWMHAMTSNLTRDLCMHIIRFLSFAIFGIVKTRINVIERPERSKLKTQYNVCFFLVGLINSLFNTSLPLKKRKSRKSDKRVTSCLPNPSQNIKNW